MSGKKYPRFIAGAVCPSCHLVDKIIFEKNVTSQSMSCVNCGYHETRNSQDFTMNLSTDDKSEG